jgi:small subunit ribosomal protein S5
MAYDNNHSEFEERVIEVNRVTRVVKGGRRMRFRTLVIIGDKKGRVAVAVAKGGEVPTAVAKAVIQAKKHLQNVLITSAGSLPHEIQASYGASTVLLKPAPEGTSLVSGGSVRTVLELAGYRNVVSKSLGSSNKINCAMATLKALDALIQKETA